MNPDRARELLTAELAELDDRARFAARNRADGRRARHRGGRSASTPATTAPTWPARWRPSCSPTPWPPSAARVQEALDRLDEGSYGRCAVCGAEIDDERLEARPEAADLPRARRHPGRGLGWPRRLSSRRPDGLVRVDPASPGLGRRRCGRGFSYLDIDGERITDPLEIARIKALVIPPAWQDVWICPRPGRAHPGGRAWTRPGAASTATTTTGGWPGTG